MKVIKPPTDYEMQPGEFSLFLGGSIELGRAENWQAGLSQYLAEQPYSDRLVIFNPRRDDWDPSIATNDTENPVLRAQIRWELDNQKRADEIVYYFAPHTIAAITLLELGLFHEREPVIYCPETYDRFANVEITAEYYGWTVHNELRDMVTELDRKLRALDQSSKKEQDKKWKSSSAPGV